MYVELKVLWNINLNIYLCDHGRMRITTKQKYVWCVSVLVLFKSVNTLQNILFVYKYLLELFLINIWYLAKWEIQLTLYNNK